jgi:Raf kinase inhibitor-like YbhB/YbcL family protein
LYSFAPIEKELIATLFLPEKTNLCQTTNCSFTKNLCKKNLDLYTAAKSKKKRPMTWRIFALSLILLTRYLTLEGESAMTFSLQSSAFGQNGEIPSQYTCEGEDLSPPLRWTEPPSGTESFVLIVDDPDAPDPAAPKMTWVHWVLYNIPEDTRELSEGVASEDLPEGTLEGINDYHRTSYGGPCPPIGRHRYFFKLYALSKSLPKVHNPTKKDVEQAMEGFVISEAELMGTYKKKLSK